MFTFPFFCPVCQKVADANADPVALLFGGAGEDFTVQCTDCETMFHALVKQAATGPEVTVKEQTNAGGE
jgi:hypothetical protein